jgi:hypothetical protein
MVLTQAHAERLVRLDDGHSHRIRMDSSYQVDATDD